MGQYEESSLDKVKSVHKAKQNKAFIYHFPLAGMVFSQL